MKKRYRDIVYSLFFFILAGLCEIGGGYMVWLWLRENYNWTLGACGGLILFAYGIIPTFQKSYFHRTYAAYGGMFIVMALLWGYIIDGKIPDKFDLMGTFLCIIGAIIIFYYPRKEKGKSIGISSSK